MTFNSQTIIQEIRAEFEMLLDFVTGEEAQVATADHIERGLFRHLLDLGAKLLLLFFVIRAKNCSREPLQMKDGQELPYHSEKKRTYVILLKIVLNSQGCVGPRKEPKTCCGCER